MQHLTNFINGRWSGSENHKDAKVIHAVNPCTEEPYAELIVSDKKEVERAVAAARKAFDGWRKESRVRRADYFDNLAQLIKANHVLLRDTISIETGKNLNESHAEVIEALHMCQYVAAAGRQPYGECVASELPTKDSFVVRKPRGVVAVIAPWNFPLAIGSFWSAAPALLEGNTVVHKPSELTPLVNHIVAGLYGDAGFPAGTYNLINGDGSTGAALVRGDIDVVLFTGSSEVSQSIKEHCFSTHHKTCSSECGSKSSTIVFEDGNMELALSACIASAFKLSGQRCVSSGRLLIQRSIFEDFKSQFLERVSAIKIGDPFKEPDAMFGPLISAEQRDRVKSFNQIVMSDNHAEVLHYANAAKNKGYFLGPFVYQCEWADRKYLKQEVFGPHVALVPFDDLDDAIRIYNDTEYGLALGAVTDDFRKHRRLAQDCTTGMLYINGGSVAAESHLPFSSWKKSGYGASAAATWKAVTHSLAVTINYEEGNITWAQGMKA